MHHPMAGEMNHVGSARDALVNLLLIPVTQPIGNTAGLDYEFGLQSGCERPCGRSLRD